MKGRIILLMLFATMCVPSQAQISYGVDVSHYQGTITWSSVSGAGKVFAYVKCSEGYTGPDDANFTTNITGGGAVIKVGAYHVAYPQNNSAANEASHFLSLAQSYTGTGYLPPGLDLEPANIDAYITTQGHTYSQLAQWINTWATQVYNAEPSGTKIWPVLYVTGYYANNLAPYYGSTINSGIKLWFADYPNANPGNPSVPSGWPWLFEQYSETGSVVGIGTNPVDLDDFNGDITALNNLIGVSSSPPICNNDDVCSPMALSIYTSCSPSACSTINATAQSTNIPFYGSSTCASLYQSGRYDDDVWFTITPTNSNPLTIVATPTSNTSNFDIVVGLYQGSCSNLTQVSCADVNGVGLAETLNYTPTAGTTYWIRIFSYGIGSTYSGNFNICAYSTCSSPSQPGLISGNTPVCSGTSTTYSISAVSGATSYTWSYSGGGSPSGTGTSTSFAPTSSGTLSVIANNSCGSSTQSTTYITVNATPAQPSSISGNTAVCSGTSTTYSIGAVSGATSYTWSYTGGGTPSGTGTSTTFAPTSSGTLSVKANNSCGSSTQSMTYITVNTAVAQPGSISGNTSVCSGTSTTYTISAVSGATSYTWSYTGGGTPTGSGTSTTFTPTSSGTLSVKANNSCGTSSASTIYITVNPVPAQPGSISGNTSICSGTSSTYSISPVSGATSYTWSYSGGGVPSSTGTSATFAPTSSGTLSVEANNTCGSSSQSTIYITVNPVPTQPGSISGNTSVCSGASSTYSISAVSGATSYTWTYTGGGSLNGTGTSVTFAPTSSGTINVTANSNCGNSNSSSLQLSVVTLPSAPTFTPANGCSPVTVTANSSNCSGCVYHWSTGSTSNTSVFTSTSSYVVTVTNSNNCSVSGTGTVTVNGQPSVSILSSKLGFCPGDSVTLSTSPTGTGYSWSGPNGFSSTAVEVVIATGGQYNVTVTNPGSCTGTASSAVNISAYTAPTANAGPDLTNAGSGVIIGGNPTASGGQSPYSYVWTPGSTLDNSTIANPTANPTSTTTYTVTVTDNNNCSASSSVSVSVGGNCSYTLSSSNVNVPSSAGYDSVMLTTSSGCAWTITGGCNWAPFNPTSGSGSSSLLFTYQQNTLPSTRTCFVNIQGNIFTITQAPDTTTGIESISNIKNISVLPNPNNGTFSVRLEGENGLPVKLNVFNAVGQLITERDIVTTPYVTLSDFDLSKCAKGIYYVQIRAEEKYYYLKVSVE